MGNSYVVRCGEPDMHTEFPSRFFFFNEWLEKHAIMRNQSHEPKLHRQPRDFYS